MVPSLIEPVRGYTCLPASLDLEVQAAAFYRQRLRDAPAHPDVENAADTDALAAITLDDLL